MDYDRKDRIKKIDGDWNEYWYDADGNRINMYYYHTNMKYAYDCSGGRHRLLWTSDHLEKDTTYAYGADGLLWSVCDGEYRFYHYDYRGSVVAVTDMDGNITDTVKYDAYGSVVERTGDSNLIFGYNGQYGVLTDPNGLLYMRTRFYNPDLKRFMNADILEGSIADSTSLNVFAYVNGNPISYVDPWGLSADRGNNGSTSFPIYGNNSTQLAIYPIAISVAPTLLAIGATDRNKNSSSNSIWSLKNDSKGIAILWHYLYGKGQDFIVHNGPWGKYMMKNDILKEKVSELIFPYGEDLAINESIVIDITTFMEIENGEDIIGYQYLHGTNADVGGFQISGKISKDSKENVTYDLTYTWNDMIDPNFIYNSDSKKAEFAKKIPLADPTDYYISISWDDKTVIKNNPGWFNWNSGWLAP